MNAFYLLLASLLVSSQVSLAQSERDFVSDRPGATDDPLTITPGHFRLETGIYAFSKNKSGETTTTDQTFGSLVAVAGVSDRVEIQLGFDSRVQKEIKTGHTSNNDEEFGDTNLRVKYNLIGNDNGDFAIGVIPRLGYSGKMNGSKLNGGIGLPMAFNLPDGWGFSVTPQWDIHEDEHNRSINEFYFGMNLGHRISESFGGAINFSTLSSEDSPLKIKAGPGLTYRMSRRVRFDSAVNLGVTRAATDLTLTLGFVYWP